VVRLQANQLSAALFVARLVSAVVGRLCRDIVDLWRGVVFEIVHIVDAAARAFLDRTARFVILLVTLLVAKPARRRRGTKIRAAIASTRARRWTAHPARPGTAKPTATRPWSAKTTTAATPAEAAARSRSAEAARARAEAAPAWRTRSAIFARPRFAHGEWTPLKRLRVELLDDFFGDGAIGEFDESKAARTTGLAIDRHGNVGWLGDGGQVSA
jgi:hypothetical protein